MTKAEWEACGDPDPMVRALPASRYQRELRLFAAACVRRVWYLLPAGCRAAVRASERFAEGQIGESKLAAAVARAEREALAADPGHREADARGYATSAAVDASSVWPRTASNVLAATTCAASAVGFAAGDAVEDSGYDAAFKAARVAELAAQADLLRGLVTRPPRSRQAERPAANDPARQIALGDRVRAAGRVTRPRRPG